MYGHVVSDQRCPDDEGWDVLQHPRGAAFEQRHDLSSEADGIGRMVMMKPESRTDSDNLAEPSKFM
jgi:hypothetical protein